jgi:hypothetical protein
MRDVGLEVLELFVEAATLGKERFRGCYLLSKPLQVVKPHDPEHRANWKREHRAKPENKEKNRLRMQAVRRANGVKPRMSVVRIQVEIFWEGSDWYFAEPRSSKRLGGPYDSIHEAFQKADKAKYEVIDVLKTRGLREGKT